MKKKIVTISIVFFVFLLIGAWVLFDKIFPKANPINKVEISRLESINIYDNEENEIVVSDDELQQLITCINGAVPTRTISVNDYPSVRPYYVIEIKTTERLFRYMLYDDNGATYVELPYEGVYGIDSVVMEFFK